MRGRGFAGVAAAPGSGKSLETLVAGSWAGASFLVIIEPTFEVAIRAATILRVGVAANMYVKGLAGATSAAAVTTWHDYRQAS